MRLLDEVQKPPFGIQPNSEFATRYFFSKSAGKSQNFFVSLGQIAIFTRFWRKFLIGQLFHFSQHQDCNNEKNDQPINRIRACCPSVGLQAR